MLTPSKRLFDHIQLARFSVVGLINTAFGYFVIVAALSLGAGDVLANATGYATGLVVSYFLNSKCTFRGVARIGLRSAARYVTLFAIAYCANMAVVLAARELGYREDPLVHLVGIGAYAGLFYAGTARFVFEDKLAATWRNVLQRRWPEVIVLGAIAMAWLLMREMSVSHDVVWQMWIARQLLGGASLYGDIMELNPPLWFWLAVPVQKVADLLGVVPKHAMIAAVFGYIVVAQLLFGILIAELDPGRRAWLLAVTAVAMIIVPITDFAQREHLALIAAIPYCALAVRRAEGRNVSWRLAIAIGLFCAVGFALKHYFIVAPLLVELWVLWRRRREWNPLRPELVTLAAAGALYGATIYFATPAYSSEIVPMLALAYFGYETPLLYQLIKPYVVFWAFGPWILYVLRRNANSLTVVFAIAAAGFALSYFVQQKGFNYHAVPATGLLFVALGTMLPTARAARTSLRIVAGAMLLPVLAALQAGPYRNLNEEVIADLLTGTERGKPIMILAARPSQLWPMVEDSGYVWPSRHFAMWMLTAFAYQIRTDGQLSLPMQELARDVRAQTVVDLQCNPPEIIIVDHLLLSKARGIDAVAFFSQDEQFRRFFANYDKARTIRHPLAEEYFTTYVKRMDWRSTAPASGCRTVY